ncbi:MAG: hypothetical protein ACYC6F_17510 [Longimicrobiales bacterium]
MSPQEPSAKRTQSKRRASKKTQKKQERQKAKKKVYRPWTYNAGERGRNWVRAYRQIRDGRYYLEWREPGANGQPLRRAVLMDGVVAQKEAKRRADRLAADFADHVEEPIPAGVSIASLIARYVHEKTPRKGASKKSHDHQAQRVWIAWFNLQDEPHRRSDRHPSSLDRVDWDDFIAKRTGGLIPGFPRPSGPRTVAYDLKFLLAVLNWAVGTPLLESNPWSAPIRKAGNWTLPKEPSPKRPGMPQAIERGLIRHSSNWRFPALLILQRETRRRNSSIRQLDWTDIDQDTWTVQWRGELDKSGREIVTPLTPAAIDVLEGLPTRAGTGLVFPADRNFSRAISRDSCQTLLRRAKAAWLAATPIEQRQALKKVLVRVGYHSEKRQGVRDPRFRQLPPKIQETLSGTTWEVLRDVYDEVSVEEMRDALAILGMPSEAGRIPVAPPSTGTVPFPSNGVGEDGTSAVPLRPPRRRRQP